MGVVVVEDVRTTIPKFAGVSREVDRATGKIASTTIKGRSKIEEKVTERGSERAERGGLTTNNLRGVILMFCVGTPTLEEQTHQIRQRAIFYPGRV